MEHLSKFMQIGSSNAVFTQVRFIQPNADWMSAERFKAVEAELSSIIEKRLPDILSLKPGAMESVNGDLTYGDIKVTYNMKKRLNMCSFVLRPRVDNFKWDAKKAKLAEESTSKFKDYGGMFQRKTVLKSELTVSMRRLTASELAQQTKVQNTQTSESSSQRGISGYFKPAVAPRPKTPEEKAALKRLLDRKETKKRHLSSSDSESNSASENLCEAFKPLKHHERRLMPSAHSERLKDSKAEENIKKFASFSQPVLEKHTPQTTGRPEAKISATQSCKPPGSSRGSSPSVQSGWICQDKPDAPKESSSPSVQSGWNHQDRPDPPKESSKSKVSSHRDKEKAKSHDSGSSSHSSSSSSRHREHKVRSEHKESRERETSRNHKTEMGKESSSKPSRSGKEKEFAQEGSRHRDKRHSPPKKLRKEEKSSSSKRTHESRDREKSKVSKPKVANIKQLLTDCGISDSDDSDKGTSGKKHRDKTSRRSPDSTQLVDVRPIPHSSKSDVAAKRESLDDFQSKKETSRAVSIGSKRQKEPDNMLCKSLFLDDEESDSGEGKVRQERSKSPATEDCMLTVNTLKKVPSLLETDVYEPTPVAKLATEDDTQERLSSKSAALSAGLDEEVSKLMSTSPHRDSYVPSYRQTPTRSEAFSYNPASPKRQDDKRKKKDVGHSYIPSSIGPSSAARPSRGRYEEYVPEAVNRTARQQQSVVDYVPTYIPTPKREINTDVSTTTCSTHQQDDRSATAEGSFSGSASIVEQEIRNARCVKDLTDKHIRYLFEKTLTTLDKISKKEVASWRFEVFLKGGPAKRALTHKVYIHKFSERQVDLILKLFLEEFGRRKRTDGDFIHQVLIPEFLTRVFMANQGTTYEESEKLMAESS